MSIYITMPFLDPIEIFISKKVNADEGKILADIFKMHLREDSCVPIHMKKYLDPYWQSKLKFI
jgi:hypothetical protein